MNEVTDRIERRIVLKAPIARVWRALATPEEFGRWFGVALSGTSMRAGEVLEGKITHPGYEHLTWRVVIERMDENARLSFRWHPAAIDLNVDYSKEPTTLVEFLLKDVAGGTELTLIESGFDKIPAHRRESAFRGNSSGWSQQMLNIENHVRSP
jgi:uncharacterized protein YndB with AHSA1/START domain